MPNSEGSQTVTVDTRDVWILGAAFTMMLATIALLVINIVLLGSNQRQLQSEAIQAQAVRHGVCLYRANLLDQAQRSEQYLAAHPNGAPALGISAASIRSTIARQKAAADSLVGLNCAGG